ncbi:MAG: helix-turn-helix domain-containing protein [Candidatus Gracilibacteria bacterium]
MYALFKALGLNDKEIQTFLKLLELGAQPISIVAKAVGIPRPSMYVVLGRLKTFQLIEEFEQRGVKYVKTIPVRDIELLIRSQERQLGQTRQMFLASLPDLESLENRISITPRVQSYDGKKACMKFYEQVAKAKEFWAFFSPVPVKKYMPEYVYQLAELIKKAKGHAKEILVDSEEARDYQKKFSAAHHEIKILPQGSVFDADILLTPLKLYLISYGENQVNGTEITSPAIVGAHRVIFDQLWQRL